MLKNYAMKLSEQEIQMVERLRKRQRSFRRWRVLLLIVFGLNCIVTSIVWIVLSTMLSRFANDDNDNAGNATRMLATLIVQTYAFPICLLSLIGSSWGFCQTLLNWHGEPKTTLLLKLIEESQKHDT